MLTAAARLAHSRGWRNVRLVRVDAAEPPVESPFDGVDRGPQRQEATRAAIRLLELTHAAYDGQAREVKSIGDGVTAVSAALALSGATVNVASRVADEADPGQVLITNRVRDHLGSAEGVELVELGPTVLRHVRDPVVLLEVCAVGHTHDVAVDPVCRMQVAETAAGAVERRHGGRLVRFCSASCARLFDEHPDAYA